MVRVLRGPRPFTKNKVVELVVAGLIGTWFAKRSWAAVTIPLPFLTFILYWVKDKSDLPSIYTTIHEYIHVSQSETTSFYLFHYFKESWKNGYSNNKYEREAYLTQRSWMDRRMLPDWAQRVTKTS